MSEQILDIISQTRDFVWGLPLLILLVGTGIFLTIRLKGLQLTKLLHALYLGLIKRKEEGDQPEWVEINVKGVRVENVRDFGGPWLGLNLMDRLGLDSF